MDGYGGIPVESEVWSPRRGESHDAERFDLKKFRGLLMIGPGADHLPLLVWLDLGRGCNSRRLVAELTCKPRHYYPLRRMSH